MKRKRIVVVFGAVAAFIFFLCALLKKTYNEFSGDDTIRTENFFKGIFTITYVLKQIHHEPCDYYQFGNKLEAEIRDYKKLKEIGIKMPAMLETDVKNERILKEFIDGDTIYQLVLEDKMKTDYIEQLHKMCALLYAANTNIDYFPTNFVVHNEEIYYVDFECNDYMEEWNFENWGVKYWSKTPEFLQYVKEHS